MQIDKVDKLLNQWSLERPELDTEGLGVVVRVLNLGRFFQVQANLALSSLDLELWEYDVASVLRRQGEPYSLSASKIAQETALSPGAMTNRIDRLEAKGLVRRKPDPDDRRGVNVSLTKKGLNVTDKAINLRLQAADESIQGLSKADRESLATLLQKLSSLTSAQ